MRRSSGHPPALEDWIHFSSVVATSKRRRNGGFRRIALIGRSGAASWLVGIDCKHSLIQATRKQSLLESAIRALSPRGITDRATEQARLIRDNPVHLKVPNPLNFGLIIHCPHDTLLSRALEIAQQRIRNP